MRKPLAYTVAAGLAFVLGLVMGRVSVPAVAPAVNPDDWSGAIRVNVIRGTELRGVRLVPYRVVVHGEGRDIGPQGGRYGCTQVIIEDRSVMLLCDADPAP